MALQWNDQLSVGVAGIDTQHRELFTRINGLLDAMSKGKGKDDLHKVIAFLDEYVDIHFKTEEDHMRTSKYPGLDGHAVQHNTYLTEFGKLRDSLESQGATSALAIQTQRFLMEWWLNHINKMDKELGKHLKG